MLEEILGHRRGASLLLFDLGFGYGQGVPLGGDQAEAGAVVLLEDPALDLAVAGGDDQGLEPLGDLPVGGDDRLEDVAPVLPLADPGQVGAARPPFAVVLVAADARGLGLGVEDGLATVGVPPREGF